ncbi:uncharacterized protein LOC141855135 [Brevipalpus obovatus]|uniref:uncharacterized protein LOC141855135 n=1 Tax=Brevipalpus obovatus TaxID=246614 RepID=UPI003D9DB44A
MVDKAMRYIAENALKVVSLDTEGQTLKFGKTPFKTQGSVGMVGGDGSIKLHELIRWPREYLIDPSKPNFLTGSCWDDMKYGPNLTIVRSKVAELLLTADIIVLHGQNGDLRGLYFSLADYERIKDKIRDIEAYYCHRRNGGSLALQFATYLIFGEVLQGRDYHYAIQDAYFTMLLYLADREEIEKTYQRYKNNITIDKEGFSHVHYPPNKQMSGLIRRHMDEFGDWPHSIRSKKAPAKRRAAFDGVWEDENDFYLEEMRVEGKEFVEPDSIPRRPLLI